MKNDIPRPPAVTAVVVNNDPAQLNLLSELLRKADVEPCAFTSVEAALAAMSAGARSTDKGPGALPALVVTDLYMPGIDGWRFCRLLRSPEYAALNQVPILVISATFAGDEASRIAADLGAEAFLPSPVEGQRFCEQVKAILTGERVRIALRVLIVDDNATFCGLLKEVFSHNGYEAQTAFTFHAATGAFRKSAYDVAVLDYHLPDGSGDALLDEFRAMRPDCVCLMMTSDTGPDLAVEWMKKGAAAYLRKPFQPSYLIELCAKARRERALLRVQDLLEARTRQLRTSEERLKLALLGADLGTWDWHVPSGAVTFNERWAAILGYASDEIEPNVRGWEALVHPDDLPCVMNALNAHLEGRTDGYQTEYRIRQKSGGYTCVLDKGRVVERDAQGKPLRVCGTHLDITESKRAAEALKESEALYHDLVETSQDLIWQCDAEGRYSYLNPAWEQVFGYKTEELLGKKFSDFQNPEIAARDRRVFADLMQGGSIKGFETVHISKSGTDIHLVFNAKFLRDKNGNISGTRGTAYDITERKRLEQELARNAAHLQAIVETEPECVKIVSPEGALLEMNPAGLKMIEAESLVQAQSRPLLDFVDPKHRSAFRELLGRVVQGQAGKLEFEAVGLKAGRRWLETHAVPLRDPGTGRTNLLGVTRDITEHKQAEAEKEKLEIQNRQLQKSESLGRMAGAIAHLFNNQLQAVMMNLELAMNELPRNAGSLDTLTGAMQSARKAADVSSLMLTYLGLTPAKRELLDLSETCLRSLSLLRAVMPQSVVLESDLPSPGPTVSANANQIQQVLTNLVTNAWEAGGDGRGAIRLTVKTVSAADIPAAHRFPIDWQPHDDSYACMEVADAGCGIPDKDIEELFDPFFSSKFTGRGMGLAVVLGIVRAHHGAVTVESEPGRGSVFRVLLPVSAQAVPPKPVQVAQAPKAAGDGAVLMVDDEPSIRKTVAHALERQGFTVLVAQDGIEAVEVFRLHRNEISCVLCDLTMPRMNGWETLTALRKLAPGIPVILASGYSEAQVMEGHHPELPQAFLSKPYEFDVLRDTIARVTTNERALSPDPHQR